MGQKRDTVVSLTFLPLPQANHFVFSGIATTVQSESTQPYPTKTMLPAYVPNPVVLWPLQAPFYCLCYVHHLSVRHIQLPPRPRDSLAQHTFSVQAHNSHQSQKKLIIECPCSLLVVSYILPVLFSHFNKKIEGIHPYQYFQNICHCTNMQIDKQVFKGKVYCNELTQWHSYTSRMTYNISILATHEPSSKTKICIA